jgi:hypothetical protein
MVHPLKDMSSVDYFLYYRAHVLMDHLLLECWKANYRLSPKKQRIIENRLSLCLQPHPIQWCIIISYLKDGTGVEIVYLDRYLPSSNTGLKKGIQAEVLRDKRNNLTSACNRFSGIPPLITASIHSIHLLERLLLEKIQRSAYFYSFLKPISSSLDSSPN